MARVNKALRNQIKDVGHGHPHRDHRSKKNRKVVYQYKQIKDYKKKKRNLKEQELLYEAQKICRLKV